MAVPIDSIKKICEEITLEIEKAYEGLSLYFVVHKTARRLRDSLVKDAQKE